MIGGNIEAGKVVIIAFNLRAIHQREAPFRENLLHNLKKLVNST
jgi:hypothetical protein